MGSTDYTHKMKELVLNWKLRLVVSALFSILGFAVLIGTVSGYVVEDFEILDQTIVGVAIFVIVIPVYLIIADLPKIDEQTVANILNNNIPSLENDARLILKPNDELNEEEIKRKKEVEEFFKDEKLYRFLPIQPIQQAAVIMFTCLLLTAGIYFYFYF